MYFFSVSGIFASSFANISNKEKGTDNEIKKETRTQILTAGKKTAKM